MFRGLLIPGALVFAACAGAPDAETGEPGAEAAPGGDTSVPPGTLGDPSPAGTQAPSAVTDACPDQPLQPVSIRRLNLLELENAVQDVFGVQGKFFTTLDPIVDGTDAGFITVGDKLLSGTAFADPLIERSIDVAEAIVASGMFPTPCAEVTEACARLLFAAPARRLYRRVPTEAELGRLARTFVEAASQPDMTFSTGVKAGLVGLLVSPQFLFVGLDQATPGTRPLTPTELATRLALTFYASVPDEPLLAAAETGQLTTDAELLAQVERMLADPKGQRFVQGFGEQWFTYQHAPSQRIDTAGFGIDGPTWAPLVADMVQETRLFLGHLFASAQPVSQLANGKFTFLNPRLAAHYGLPAPSGTDFSLVQLPPDMPRAGILTQGTLLASSSEGKRASVVRRGKRVLLDMLCDPPPDPAGIPALQTEIQMQADNTDLSERGKMDARAQSPACASCHAVIDPLGWAFQNYNPVGRFEATDEAGQPLTPGGTFGAAPFASSGELLELIAQDKRLPRCVVEKLLIYSVGRSVKGRDRTPDSCVIDDVLKRGGKRSFPELTRAVVLSRTFRTRVSAP